MTPKVAIVIPTYNERDNVGPLVTEIEKLGIPNLRIHFIDDSSPDGTTQEIKRMMTKDPNVNVTTREGRMGLGSAIILGFKEELQEGADILVTMDSDFQHPPRIIPDLIGPVRYGTDVVIASRKIAGGGASGFSFRRKMTSRGADWFARTWLGLPVKDGTNNFKAYSRRAAEILVGEKGLPNGYSFEIISLYRLKKKGMTMMEIPFDFESRKYGKSKLGVEGILHFVWDVLTAAISQSAS